MLNLLAFPFIWRIGARNAFASARVLHIGAAVPLDDAAIKSVVEDARAAIELTADGRVGPGPAAGTGDAPGAGACGVAPSRRGRPGGFGGVPQSVGREFNQADKGGAMLHEGMSDMEKLTHAMRKRKGMRRHG